jgi:hypothetical protein
MTLSETQCRDCGQHFLWLSGNDCILCSECQRKQCQAQVTHQHEPPDHEVADDSLTQLPLPGFEPKKHTDWWLI